MIIKKDTVAGKKVDIAYLVTDGWALDEYADLVKEGSNDAPDITEEDIQI